MSKGNHYPLLYLYALEVFTMPPNIILANILIDGYGIVDSGILETNEYFGDACPYIIHTLYFVVL